jgi:PPK2 family polyphosphate:nucleotide phosphotransferase
MTPRKLVKELEGIAAPYCIVDGKKFRLKNFDTGDTDGVKSKKVAQDLLQASSGMLAEMQEKLYAQDLWALLLIFQGMDAAGKDGAIKHVMSGINPQGCDVHAFKAPNNEEVQHDFLWREHKALPSRGKIGIFNRSYYEEVLVVRMHPHLLKTEKLPDELVTKHIWEERYEDINFFERFLTRNGVVIRKFFLHVSKEEQKKRFLERLGDSKKNWKFSMDDIKERKFWDGYQEVYEEMVQNTATKRAPWYVVPADNKWYGRLVVASAIIEALNGLDLAFPDVDKEKKKELEEIREALLKGND